MPVCDDHSHAPQAHDRGNSRGDEKLDSALSKSNELRKLDSVLSKGSELRFKIGDRVFANVGDWVPGTIIRHWDDGCAYRIKLHDEEATNVYAQHDTDEYVRKTLPAKKKKKKLRFKVGERVYANVGDWVPGIIVKHWDDGCPYRIQLHDQEGTHVFGPYDTDQYVRKTVPKEKRKLRFKVGDHIYANIGDWVPGTIIKVWDDGSPYRIRLNDTEGTNVWGPVDSDQYVRKEPPPEWNNPPPRRRRNDPTEPGE